MPPLLCNAQIAENFVKVGDGEGGASIVEQLLGVDEPIRTVRYRHLLGHGVRLEYLKVARQPL